MPIESELRAALRDPSSGGRLADGTGIDSAEVIRRARARRRPKQVAFGSVATLAVAGFAWVGISAIPWPQAGIMSASDTLGDATGSELALPDAQPGATDPVAGGAHQEPASSLNRCGEPLIEVGPTASGLVLTTDFPSTGAANGLPMDGTVTLTNTGQERVTGVTAAQPTIVLSQDGITLWHSNGMMRTIEYLVDLAPGESKEFAASLTPVRCTEENPGSYSLPGGLPPLGPGTYRVTAFLELEPLDPADAAVQLVGGPSQDLAVTGG